MTETFGRIPDAISLPSDDRPPLYSHNMIEHSRNVKLSDAVTPLRKQLGCQCNRQTFAEEPKARERYSLQSLPLQEPGRSNVDQSQHFFPQTSRWQSIGAGLPCGLRRADALPQLSRPEETPQVAKHATDDSSRSGPLRVSGEPCRHRPIPPSLVQTGQDDLGLRGLPRACGFASIWHNGSRRFAARLFGRRLGRLLA